MRYSFLLVLLLASVAEGRVNKIRRVKRDDGAFLKDSGGPVASSSEGEGEKSEAKGGAPPLDECEISLAKALSSIYNTASGLASSAANASKNAVEHPIDTASNVLTGGFNAGSSLLSSAASGAKAVGSAALAGAETAAGTLVNGTSAVLSGGLDMVENPAKIKDQLVSWAKYPKELFDKYVKTYNKTYVTPTDLAYAFASFVENLSVLTKLVLGRFSPYDAAFVITEFMDLKFDDFTTHFTGALLDEIAVEKIDVSLLKVRKCKSLNWTSLDVVPDVRRQEKCGCCYAMSTGDMIAAQYNIDQKKFGSRFSLSPQWLLNCMEPPVANHCGGGRPALVLKQLQKYTKWNTLPLESCLPYEDKNNTCKPTVKCPAAPDVQVRWGKMVDISGDREKELMAALLQHGPVVVIVGVTSAWQMYNGTGILRAYQCSEKQAHAVLVTGYDYTTCVPTYTIKNSWGTRWGGRGYIKLEAGKNTCAIAKNVVFTCTSDECENIEDHLKYVLSHPKHPDCH